MARTKPTPPPNPSLPFWTVDTLATVFLRPILSPTVSLLPPLILLALRHEPFSRPALLSYAYTLSTLAMQAALALDARLGAGRPRPVHWAEEVVLVTGGAGGLGRCVAAALGLRGADVVVVDVLPEDEARKREWEAAGCMYYRCDVGERGAVEELRKRMSRDVGLPTILVNAAAVATFRPFLDIGADELARDLRVNVASYYNVLQTFLPAMLSNPNGGTIVTVSSVLGSLGCAGLSSYTASKAALTALHNSLKAELPLLAEHDNASRVNMILATPGQLGTPLFARVTPPSDFFGPVVTPASLAADIIAAIDAGVDAELATPLYARLIAWFGVLPLGVRGLARRVAGLDRAGWRAGEEARGKRDFAD